MPDLGIFDDDKFSLQSLTAAVNEQPAKPRRIADLGLFEEEPVSTTAVNIERNADSLTLVPNAARGGDGDPTGDGARDLVPFITSHLPTTTRITADDVQNIRAFGYASELDAVSAYVNRKMAKKRRRIEATIEYQRIGAIKGKVVDADGITVLADIFAKFGMTQQTQVIEIGKDTGADAFIGQVLEAKDKSEEALGDAQLDGYRVFCGKSIFRDLIVTPDVKDSWKNWQQLPPYSGDVREGFRYADAIWEEYRGGVGGVPFIDPDEAYLVPEGVEELFTTVFAPADYMETVNTPGLPMYAKQWMEPSGKSLTLEQQSNPMSFSTRPRAIIKLVRPAAE